MLDDGKTIGVVSSGGYGHAVEKSLAFADVKPAYTAPGTEFDIVVLDQARRARVLAEPVYDPKNERLRA